MIITLSCRRHETVAIGSQAKGMRLLLADEDNDFAAFISRGLTRHDHDIRVAANGRDALLMASDDDFAAVILERHLPLVDGLAVLRDLRGQGKSAPIIFLTSIGDPATKIEAFDAGADDYIIKPVAIGELDARLRAIARRPSGLISSGLLRTSTIEVDLFRQSVKRGGRAIPLPLLEFRILVELLQNVDKVLTRQRLLKNVWGYDEEPGTNIVASHIARIRAKLNVDDHVDAIRTVHGAGYVIHGDV